MSSIAPFIEVRSGTATAGLGRLIILRDVGVQAEACRTLHECDSRSDSLRHATLDAMVLMAAQGRIRSWNRAAGRMFGWQAAEALGQDRHALLAPPEHRAAFIARASDWSRRFGDGCSSPCSPPTRWAAGAGSLWRATW